MPTVYSSENRGSISFEHIDTAPLEYDESLQFKIELESCGFRGGTTFWVSFDEWKAFLDELREFNQKLNGRAKLAWGYTEEDRGFIEALNIDGLGHLKIIAKAQKQVIGTHGNNAFGVQIGIEIEPEELNKWLADLMCIKHATKS